MWRIEKYEDLIQFCESIQIGPFSCEYFLLWYEGSCLLIVKNYGGMLKIKYISRKSQSLIVKVGRC